MADGFSNLIETLTRAQQDVNVQTLLGQLQATQQYLDGKEVRVLISDSRNFGHQSSSVNVMLRLIAMRRASTVAAVTVFVAVAALMIPAGRHLPVDAAPDWLENILYSRYLLATLALMAISSNVSMGQKTEPTAIASA